MARGKQGAVETSTESKVDEQTEFTKEQLVKSTRYANRKDLVDALLDDGKKYTFEFVDERISEFMKGKVK